MMKARIRSFAFAGALAVLASSGAWAQAPARLGHAMPESFPQAAAMNRFAELAAKYTNNNVKIQVHHGGVLGGDEKQLQAVQTGTQEFYIGVLSPLSTRVREIQIWDLPFLFADSKEAYAVLDGPAAKKIFDKLEPAGIVGLTWTTLGFRNLSNSKRPVHTLADIEGLKIRTMTNPVALETWKALGANPTPMAITEVFTALEIKAIDGQENPLQNMYSNKMQEVQKYISLTNHVYTPSALVVSKKYWDKLSEADKAGVRKAAVEAGVYQREMLDGGDQETIRKFEAAGVRVNPIAPAELAKIQERLKPVVAKFTPQIGEEFVSEFFAEIEAARKTK